MKKSFILPRLFLFLLACLLLFPALPFAEEREPRTIRVAYPIQSGLTMMDGNGNYSGYSYEYLMEISQYTGWKYEFVAVEGDMDEQLTTLMDKMKNGEIDLFTGMYYDETLLADYSYPGQCYGNNYSGIFVPEDSPFTESSLYASSEIRVGVHSRALKPNEKLQQFADMNRLNVEQVVVSTADEVQQLIRSGKVDAIFSTDLALGQHQDMRAIARFSPMPFYMVTTKGNVDVLRQLDYALSTIDQVNPNFSVSLYNKYFSSYASSMRITDEEADFIKNCGPLDVVMYNNKPPFQYADPKTGEPTGITVEVLAMISESTGLSFRYQMVSTYKEYLSAVQSGQVDISADTVVSYQDAADQQSTLTVPWHSLPLYMLFREDSDLSDNGRCAIPYFFKNVIPKPKYALYYDTVEECMDAVKNGMADYCYSGEFCSQYMLNSGVYDNLNFLNQSDHMTQKLCFGIRDTKDHYLLGLFNKAITNLDGDAVDEVIYRNTYRQQEIPFWVHLKNNSGKLAITALVIVLLCSVYAFYSWSRKQNRIAFENERYHMLSNLANEYFYEYDPFRDQLSLSDKCAEAFSCAVLLDKFSVQLAALPEDGQSGIWQLGPSLIRNLAEGQDVLCTMPDETQRWFKVISSFLRDSNQRVLVIGKISDIHATKLEQFRLEQDASQDGLTHIYNIATARRLVEQCLAQADAHDSCALVILDVDNFKSINDRFGHFSGDAVLIQTADAISALFPSGVAGRLGGDEFIIFVEQMDADTLAARCHELRRIIADKSTALLGAPATLSIGAAYAAEGETYDDLYREADNALYHVKSTAKNGFSLFAK